MRGAHFRKAAPALGRHLGKWNEHPSALCGQGLNSLPADGHAFGFGNEVAGNGLNSGASGITCTAKKSKSEGRNLPPISQ
jgi:hypothetical protein